MDGDNKSNKGLHHQPKEWPFPGFSQFLVGMAPDEQKSIEDSYPDDAGYNALSGKQAKFRIQVEGVKSRQLPDLDDEFAKTVGNYSTLPELEADVRSSLETQARATYNETYDEEILTAAIEQTSYKYADEMVEDEIETVIKDMSDLDTITSAGIRAIQKLYQMYNPKEDRLKIAHLKLCNAPPQIYNVLGITGFLQNIPMYENLDDALGSFGKE